MKIKRNIGVVIWAAAVVYLCVHNMNAAQRDSIVTTGLVIHAQQTISAPITGTVHRINPALLDSVKTQDAVAALIDPVYYQIRDQVREKGTGDSSLTDMAEDTNNLMGFVTSVETPIAGSVTKLHVLPGAGVLQGEPLMTITSLDTDYIMIYVDPSELVGINLDTKAQIITDRESIEGVVSQIGVSLVDIPNELSRSMFNTGMGVPIKIRLTGEINLRHAQLVDVQISTSPSASKTH
ncbi:MAG: hypothetical protein COA73_00300 [Candidatus Hydrogenedentota bacterium]|nr:MAG: hypothetical protein COA73_00300 [Candidatus Hydrogenedentota bacterium]